MTTFSTTISQSSDDAQEAAGTVTIDGGALNANSATGYFGVRFNNVTIPQGATINTATMDLYFTSGSFDDPDVTIYGEDVDDAATFTTAASSISSRAATTATASWDAASVGTGVKTSPDFASVVQEIVNRAGWASGNDMVIIFKGDDASTLMRVRAYEAGGGDYATIDIDYTGDQTLTGAYISAGTTLYAGTIANFNQVLTGAYISAGTTLYAGTIAHNNATLTGAYITATTTLYAGLIGVDTVLTGAYITATTALYSGHIYTSPIRLVGMTHHEISELSSTSFTHETPAGDDRLLVVVATYTDTAGIASLVFGSSGTGNGEFAFPLEIAIDSDDCIYVVDYNNNRVQKFDSAGGYLLDWGSFGSGNGLFNSPRGIAIDSSNNIYVVDSGNNRIQKFDGDGVYIDQWGSSGTGDGELNTPHDIAIDNNNYVYVSDSNNSRVQKFDGDGNFITKWGSSGTGNGQFSGLRGIAAGPGNLIYTVELSTIRIQVFSDTGEWIDSFGESGSGNGQFISPYGIAVNNNGDVFIVDGGNYRIQHFDNNYEFVTKWGRYGVGNGQFNSPVGIGIDRLGALYVADSSNHRVQKFDAGLKLNRAYYGTEPMEVGPLVDAGSYYQAFYTLANPTVGSAEVVLTAPTGPDKFMITAMSFVGVETATVDYTAPDAGRAEAETSTTALQISHSRTYPARTLSLWALLYETASTTLTAAANNFHLLTRTLGTLNTALGWRVFPSATSGSQTFGATASPAVTQKITAVLHLQPKLTNLTAGAYISPTTTLYAGTITHDGQTMYGAYIDATTTLYAGQVDIVLDGAYISAGTTLYAGTIEGVAGPDQTLTGVFIGVGLPSAINGAYISPATDFFAGVITTEVSLEGAYIEAGSTLYAGTLTGWDSEATGAMWAGTIFNVS